ncbi:unnamed protein product [Arctia plantaginis]|uniref:C2H2-type domain-containing protein n=1 Tax=Arctia plantaginis TaxID=874455 RepID=A0A8S1BVH2_ARCPL|nr:unnamed protein product [Arctia plantaginis]
MDVEDDMIVLVVVDDDEEKSTIITESEIKIEPEYSPEESLEVGDLIKTAEELGEYIPVKTEPSDPDYPENYECDYLEDEVLQGVIKSEYNDDRNEDSNNCSEFGMSLESDAQQESDKHRFTMLKPWQQKSFVAELRQEYPELREDEELLINTLEQIMRSAKPPPPPRDYYIMTGIMFECIICGGLTDTIPAASRHYQEKHGQRYLVCYACGVDFRSASNLYKHEKRCVAPDARVVLRARAQCLGRKGRSRPYLQLHALSAKPDKIRFPCQLCSAVFMTRRNLQSHENLHRGERPYRCHACPCAYTSYSALSRHTMKHTDVQFICDDCNRSFKIKAALVSHMDTHKPMRKHGCTECNRRFAQKSALRLHVNRVHRNLPPPCACRICPKRYPRMSLLKSHMKREHGMSIITRKMFFKSLPTMTELEIKQSKVILKSEDDALEYQTPFDTDEMFKRSMDKNRDYEKVNKSQNSHCEVPEENPAIDAFMKCVTKSNKSLGSNVIYIQNGEVVEDIVVDGSRENLILQVEAMVESEVLLDPLSTKH